VLVLVLATKMMTNDEDIARAIDAAEARVAAAYRALEVRLVVGQGVTQ
jgi:hypothetical protein